MKDFLRYSKNRFLYSFFKLLILIAIAFLIGSFKVKADTTLDMSTWVTVTGRSWSDTGVEYSSEKVYNDEVLLNHFNVTGGVYNPPTDYSFVRFSYFEKSGEVFNPCNNGTFTVKLWFLFTDSSFVNYVKSVRWGNNVCAIEKVPSSGRVYATCIVPYVATTFNDIFVDYDEFYTDKTSSLYISRYNSLTCSLDSNTIITNDNKNTDRIIENNDKNNKKINDKLDTAENTRKGIWETIKGIPGTIGTFFDNLGTKIGNFFKDLLDGILEGLKKLFIPEDDYFKNWFDDFKTYFEEKLGFIATPFTIIIDFVNSYLNLSSSNDIIIDVPDITVPNFEENKIISATTFNWSQTLRSKQALNTLWQLYLSFIDVYLILNFINLCESKYNRIFGGDTSNYEYYTVEDSYTFDNDTGEVLSARRNERTTTRKKVE